MNESDDRPTPTDRPAPHGDPSPTLGDDVLGESAERAGFVVESEPEPEPALAGESEPAAPKPVALQKPSLDRPIAAVLEDNDDDGYEGYDERASRWASLLATMGTALIGIVTVQVLTSIVEGLTLKSRQRVGIPDDLFHRIGYPFGGLGATALVFLVLGVVLVAMPSVLDELLSESQDRVVGVALIVATVMGVVIAIGSLLAVRANLHEYAAKNVPVPSYVRVQFTNFLLGSLGAAALALFGSVAAMNERKRESL